LWGIYSRENRVVKRRYRIDGDIRRIVANKNNEPFITYVMGKDNMKALEEKGFECRLVHDEPFMFDIRKYQYRHKLECIRVAMEEDGYDEIVYLDWDCLPTRPLPDDFWDSMSKRGVFQANLQQYKRKKCMWRRMDRRKVPNGGFLYLADQSLPQQAIAHWEKAKQDNDEPAWARLTDEMLGGWKGPDEYWDKFEAMYCDLHNSSVYLPKSERKTQKNICFKHYQGGMS
jgi:hypothetical protein